MKSQDIPASPTKITVVDWEAGKIDNYQFGNRSIVSMGETKYEKAFWQVYSAMVVDPELADSGYDNIADHAIEAVNTGFKALENRDEL